MLIPGLNTTIGERSIVVNHTGSIDSQGWEIYWAYPADRDGTCLIESVRGTTTFTDCDGRRPDWGRHTIDWSVLPQEWIDLFRTGTGLEIAWLTTLAARSRKFKTKIPPAR